MKVFCAPFAWDEGRRYDRGKVLSSKQLEEIAEFGRYKDVDGDGVPYRTLPGVHPTLGAYFTRGTSRDRYARYTEDPAPYVDNMERLALKFETARRLAPPPVATPAPAPSPIGLIHYGSTGAALDEALDLLARAGHPADALRIRAFPLHPEIAAFVEAHPLVFVVEQNRDGQMRTLMASDLAIDPARLNAILHYGGAPITARFIADAVAEKLKSLTPPQMLEGVS